MPLHVIAGTQPLRHLVARPRHGLPSDHRLERTASCSQCEIAHGTARRDARYFAPLSPSVGKPGASIMGWGWTMIANEPDAEVWRRLFASLTGNSAVDADVVREFCEAHGVTPAQVMAEMHNHRRIAQQGE